MTTDARIPASRYTPLEIAAGWLPGWAGEPLPDRAAGSAREHLERSLLRALSAGRPVVVAFSGGRDSSALLATAVRVARRHGLPEPVPCTYLYDDASHEEERRFQQRVIDHLECRDWLRIDVADRHDLLGDEALRWLRTYGPTVPAFGYSRGLMFTSVPRAIVVTGEGGDIVLGNKRSWLLRNVVDRRGRVPLHVLGRTATTLMPASVRRGAARAEVLASAPWLREDARKAYESLMLPDLLDEPLDWRRATWRVNGMRALREGLSILDDYASRHECSVEHPLLDRDFVCALSFQGGRLGFRSRTEAMRALFADLLPDEVLRRRDKAGFNAAVMGPRARSFVESWNGEGVDDRIVDPEMVRSTWLAPSPHAGSLSLLHATWVSLRRGAS